MNTLRSLVPAGMLLAGSLCLAGSALAQGVEFDGITHHAVGQAQLSVQNQGLVVSGLTGSGRDGVVSALDKAQSWEAKISIAGNQVGDTLKLGAFAEGVRTAGARLEMISNGFLLSGRFTGADGAHLYTVQVLRNNQVVAEFPDVDGGDVVIGPLVPWQPPIEPIPWPIPWPWPWPWPDFEVGTLGECIWGFQFGEEVSVSLEGASGVVGDQVRLIEAKPAGGHSVYLDFDAIRMQSSGNTLVIHEENQISNGF